jgi:hypothetical protein
MLCPNEIYISYVIRPALGLPVPVGPLTLLPAGEFNGKSYYTWFDDNLGYDLFLAWNNIDLRWEIGSGPLETMTVFSYSDFGDTDCPVAGAREAWIGILKLMTNITTELGPRITEPLTEEQICYPILVWNKQCEFAQCVLKYLRNLQFGAATCCEELDYLKEQRRILEIINCYDTRDIPDNTVNYNFLTYNQIKKLLNS